MNSTHAFRLTQGFYSLFLGLWVGAMVMLAVSAGITFKTVREYKPLITVAPYRDATLIGKAEVILAGGIVGQMLRGLAVISGVCAAVVAVCLVLQYTCFRNRLAHGGNSWLAATRIVLLLLPMAVIGWNEVYLTPTIHRERAAMYDPEQGEDARAMAKGRFDLLHKLSERTMGLSVLMLACAALLSPFAFVDEREPLAPASGK